MTQFTSITGINLRIREMTAEEEPKAFSNGWGADSLIVTDEDGGSVVAIIARDSLFDHNGERFDMPDDVADAAALVFAVETLRKEYVGQGRQSEADKLGEAFKDLPTQSAAKLYRFVTRHRPVPQPVPVGGVQSYSPVMPLTEDEIMKFLSRLNLHGGFEPFKFYNTYFAAAVANLHTMKNHDVVTVYGMVDLQFTVTRIRDAITAIRSK